MELVSLYAKFGRIIIRQKGIKILNPKLKITIKDELIEAGYKDNTFNVDAMYGHYQKLLKQAGKEKMAANMLVQAIRQAGLEGASNKTRHTREIDYLVDDFILRDAKDTDDVKAIVQKRNKKPIKQSDARETVPDWDKQEVLSASQEELDIQDDRFVWMECVRLHHNDKKIYKQIRTFDGWQEWNKKRAISGN